MPSVYILIKHYWRRTFAAVAVITGIILASSIISRKSRVDNALATTTMLKYFPPVNDVVDISSINPIFKPLDRSKTIFLTSVYLEPDKTTIRLFILKHIKVKATIECILEDESQGKYTIEATALKQDCIYWGIYRGYISFCRTPSPVRPGLLLTVKRNDVIAETPKVSVPIAAGLPPLDDTRPKMPHVFGLCLTAVFNSRSYSADFIIEYLELHRKLGLSFIAIYAAEEFTPTLKRILDSYSKHPAMNGTRSFDIHVVKWILPIANPSNTTWYHEQTMSQNDCLHRFGRQVEYLLNTDLDEILIPASKKPINTEDLPSWYAFLPDLQTAYRKSETLCFPGKFFPPDVTKPKDYMYDRKLSTVEAYPERAKCMIFSGFVSEAYVHRPIEPAKYRLAPESAVIYHYRTCLRKEYRPCPPGTRYAVDDRLQAYRQAVRQEVDNRKLLL